MTPTEIDIAWAAGLFEGEGTLTLNGASKSPRLKLSLTDFDVVRKFYKIVGGGNLCIWKDKQGKYKQQLCWYTGRKSEVARIIEMLMGHFGERRLKQASKVLSRAINAPFEGWDGARIKESPTEIYS